MSEAKSTTPPAVTAFNQKVHDLLKTAKPEEASEILSHPASLLRAADNVNQNQGRRQAEKE
jgi:hypothetical protein